MECSLCAKNYSSKTPFHCATCARSILYVHRIDQAKLLLEKEGLRRQASAVISAGLQQTPTVSAAGLSIVEAREGGKKYELERNLAVRNETQERIELISHRNKTLQEEIEQCRVEITARKQMVARRRAELKTSQDGLAARRNAALEHVKKRTERVEQKWHRLHDKTVEDRSFLVREAANLAGLRLRRRKTKDGRIKEDYTIYGVGIVDLRDLNSAPAAQITASLTHLANLLMLCSRYLQLRLPAEITLPHPDYPLPTIFTPTSSYLGKEVPFPGSTPSHSSSNTPDASRALDHRPPPRPRPLFLDRKLTRLAKEDPPAYALFVEGVCLVAWDIAWLCGTQGVSTGFNAWEDVCAIGKNLWQLLVAPPSAQPALPPPVTRRIISNKDDVPSAASPPPTQSTTATPSLPAAAPGPPLGHFSHGTSHSFLARAEGNEYMRSWKLLHSPMKIIDKVKAALQAEMSGAEWEVLDEKEWDEREKEGGLLREEPIFVGGGGRSVKDGEENETESIVSGTTVVGQAQEDRVDSASEGRPKGTSGWTKVKSRGS